jgi:ferredoxin
MVSAAYVDGGVANGCYWCQTCEEYMHRYFEYDDETGPGEIYANDKEIWEKIQDELGRGE